MNDLNLISLWDRMLNDQKHKQKIKEIQERSKEFTVSDSRKYYKHLQKGKRNVSSLGESKHTFPKPKAERKKTLSKDLTPVKSLNSVLKKQEERKIHMHNQVLGERIKNAPSFISYKILKQQYKKNCKYSMQISKTALQDKIKKIETRHFRTVSASQRQNKAVFIT